MSTSTGRLSAFRRSDVSCGSGVSPRFLAAAAAACLLATAGTTRASDDTETANDVLRVALPAAAFALTLKRDDREGRRQFYRSFGANVAATWILKEAFDKARPDGEGDDAFPSGHASMAFQGAAFIHRRYGIRQGWPAYAVAGFVAWERVDSDEHDWADVLAGAGIGIASAYLLVDRAELVVAPAFAPGYVGLTVSGTFR
ncbi:MAG TPA: phosphatase PAP2 family protein [Gammaproteobacteria bacterium]